MNSPSDTAADSPANPDPQGRVERGGAFLYPMPAWEPKAIGVALAVYFVYQFNAILHHGSWGQDFISHVMFTAKAYADPYKFWTTYVEAQNNPPLFHMLCAAVYKMTKHVHSLEVISLITTLLNMGALLLLHRLGLRMIAAPLMRLAAMLFVIFLPAGMIHAVVLAADALATPTTVTLMYLLVRMAETARRTWREFLTWGVLALAALALAVSIKFTAISLVPAAGAVIVLMWLGRAADLTRTGVALLLVVAPVAVLGIRTYTHYKTFQKSNLGVNIRNDPFAETTELNVRSVLLPKRADVKLLRAPQYDAPSEFVIEGHRRHEMAVPNRYSYIGLLHVGVFTDVLNVYQHDPLDRYIGRRSSGAQQRMRWAVRTAVPFTACAVVAVPWMLVWSAWRVIVRRGSGDGRAMPVLTVLTVSFAFFLVIVGFFPFVGALAGGYWLPRLIIPALFGFLLIMFAFLDRTIVGRSNIGRVACLAAVIGQCLLSLSFLWPWGVNGPEAPQLPLLAGSNLAVHAELDVRFIPQPPGTGDPLLTIGRYGVAQFVYAKHDAAGNVRITFNHWGLPQLPESEPLPADPNRTYHIVIDTDPRAETLVVNVDGKEALRVHPLTPIAAYRDEIHPFKNPAGGGLTTESFAGTEVAKTIRARGGKRWGRGTGK